MRRPNPCDILAFLDTHVGRVEEQDDDESYVV
jgi:hypothetical protein